MTVDEWAARLKKNEAVTECLHFPLETAGGALKERISGLFDTTTFLIEQHAIYLLTLLYYC